MFGELPKIFERNFVVGYVLPSALFLLFSYGFTHDHDPWKFLKTSEGVPFAISAFTLGVALLAANRSITRVLEGYGRFNPARLLIRIQRWRFRRLRQMLDATVCEYRSYGADEHVPVQVRRRGELLETRLVERYPEMERLVLPTGFGNCVRAFERYPYVMYKLEIIEGWTRLVAVIPKHYLELINTAKAETDLWINLWFLSLVTIADSILTWSYTAPTARKAYLAPLLDHLTTNLRPYSQPLLTSVGALGLAFFASWMAARAAIEWGSTFKAAVDVYLPALYGRLGFPAPVSYEDVEARWDSFSDAISYRRPKAMRAARWVVSPSPTETPPATAPVAEIAPAARAGVLAVKRFAKFEYVKVKAASLLARANALLSRPTKEVPLTAPARRTDATTAPTQNNGSAAQSTPPRVLTNDNPGASSEEPHEQS